MCSTIYFEIKSEYFNFTQTIKPEIIYLTKAFSSAFSSKDISFSRPNNSRDILHWYFSKTQDLKNKKGPDNKINLISKSFKTTFISYIHTAEKKQ